MADVADPTPPAAPPAPRRSPAWLGDGAAWAFAVVVVAAAVIVPSAIGTTGLSVVTATDQGLHLPPEGPNQIGVLPFDGPTTAQAIVDSCLPDHGVEAEECYQNRLVDLLMAQGVERAFQELDNLTKLDPVVAADGHPFAHTLGRTALIAYGGPVTTLEHCPYTLASGCFHGVMQSYFDTQVDFDMRLLPLLCPMQDFFRLFQCQHGLGHGLEIYTNYDLNRSLQLCDTMATTYSQSSCETGAIMENLMGYLEAIHPSGAGGHNHGTVVDRPPPVYMLKEDDPQYPCDVLGARYGRTCYIFQTSVYLQLHNWDMAGAAAMCDAAPKEFWDVCFNSMGRDASALAQRDPQEALAYCRLASDAGLPDCVKGFVQEMINNAANPRLGLTICDGLPEDVLHACYSGMGYMAASLMPDVAQRTALCKEAGDYEADCRKDAQLV